MDKTTINDLPIIDWQQGAQLAGNSQEIARELMGILIKNLPSESAAIKNAFKENRQDDLWKGVHKLRGAVAYCGVPRLKKVVERLEKAIREDIIAEIPTHIDELDNETNVLLQYYRNTQQT